MRIPLFPLGKWLLIEIKSEKVIAHMDSSSQYASGLFKDLIKSYKRLIK